MTVDGVKRSTRLGDPQRPAEHRSPQGASPPTDALASEPDPPSATGTQPTPALLAACSTPEELQRDFLRRGMRPWAHTTLPHRDLYKAPPVIIHPGDPDYGTLTTVRIQHLRPETQGPDLAAALTSELAALGYLQANRPRHVFAEGVIDEPPNSHARIRAQVAETFAGWRPGDVPNDRQLSALAQLGGARLYALLHADVTLHAVATPAESAADDAHFNACRAAGRFANIAIVFDRREQRVVERLQGFFGRHRGESAVVVFGAHHDFGRHVSPAFDPRVIEVQLTP